MSLFGGGSSQAAVTNQANISYSPFLNLGNDNESSQKEWFSPSATTSPKQDGSAAGSVGVGIGAEGSGGTVTRSEDPFTKNVTDPTPKTNDFFADTTNYKDQINKYAPYVLGLGGLYILTRSFKVQYKKKAK